MINTEIGQSYSARSDSKEVGEMGVQRIEQEYDIFGLFSCYLKYFQLFRKMLPIISLSPAHLKFRCG